MERLTGSALLAHYEAAQKGGVKKGDAARTAGYVKELPDGKVRVLFSAFQEALLQAKGVCISKARSGKRGRELSYETAVLGPGHAVIGQGYLAQIGAEPQSRLSIRVKGKELILKAVAPAAESTADAA